MNCILKTVPKEQENLFFADDKLDKSHGYVGHIRGVFGKSGDEFSYSWLGRDDSPNSSEFNNEIRSTIVELQKQGLLKGLESMSEICYRNSDAKIECSFENNYGFRYESEKYSYYIRTVLNPGDYNFYIYIYLREKLEEYLLDTKDNYHEKFERLYHRTFSGNHFNSVEFFHHLQNINFHFEEGELSKLSDVAICNIKAKFRFFQYGANIKGLDINAESYAEDFRKLVEQYGEKYGYKEGHLGE